MKKVKMLLELINASAKAQIITGVVATVIVGSLVGGIAYYNSVNNANASEQPKYQEVQGKEEAPKDELASNDQKDEVKEDNKEILKEEAPVTPPVDEQKPQIDESTPTPPPVKPEQPTPPQVKPEQPKPTPPPVEQPKPTPPPSVAVAPPNYNGGLMINETLTNQLNSKLGKNKNNSSNWEQVARKIVYGTDRDEAISSVWGVEAYTRPDGLAGGGIGKSNPQVNSNDVDVLVKSAKDIGNPDNLYGTGATNDGRVFDKVYVVYNGSTNILIRVGFSFFK